MTYLKKTKRFEKGQVYEGNFKDGWWHGTMKIIYPDGATYNAKFKMGENIHLKQIK